MESKPRDPLASEAPPTTTGGDNEESAKQEQEPPTDGVQNQGEPPPPKPGSCCSSACRKIGLLIWKNLKFRKRHYIITALEIIIPLLFTLVVCLALYIMFSVKEALKEGGKRPWHGSESGPNFTIVKGEEEGGVQCTPLEWHPGIPTTLPCKMLYINPDNDALVEDVVKELTTTAVVWKSKRSEDQVREEVLKYSLTKLLPLNPQAVIHFDKKLAKIKLDKGATYNYGIRFISSGNLVEVQAAVDKALIRAITGLNTTFTYMYHSMDQDVGDIRRTPEEPENTSDGYLLPGMLSAILIELGFIFLVPSTMLGVINEKESGIKELMKLSGIPNWMHWFGWTVNFAMVFTITVTLITIILFTIVFGTDPGNAVLFWIVLWLYVLASTSFCIFLSSFFSKPVIAIIVGMLVWVVTAIAPAALILRYHENVDLSGKMGISLMPNAALFFAFTIIIELEKEGGSGWSNLFTSDGKAITLGLVIVMLLVDIVLYLLLALYFEAILPSEYGVRRPVNFLFTPSFWGFGNKATSTAKVGQDLALEVDPYEDNTAFERNPEGLTVGVEIKNMRKLFGRHAAVDGVSLKMFDGEIFALLGHNGAGKTTVISCCTGMMAPTSGTAIINGFDIITQMDLVREKIGICPQHNLLFDDLTVDEHLKFFGKLKGMSSAEAKQERMEMLEKLQLTSKKDTLSKKLSGGQKRKLCLGISLIGNAKVVFLDEPTSGMDVEARRAIWDLLLFERGHRTIILTTHFMEEADVLGDRIGIMAHGRVQCCGTSTFLKRYYGTGYTLSMTMTDISQDKRNNVLSTVQALVPSATFIEDATNASPDELDINLPTEACSTSTFSKIFKSLQDKKQSLGIKTFGLSLTTMDEVFVKVDEAYSNSSKNRKLELTPVPTTIVAPGQQVTTTANTAENLQNPNNPEGKEQQSVAQEETEPVDNTAEDLEKKAIKKNAHVQGISLILLQFLAFLIKRFHYNRRKWKLFFSQILVPLLMTLVAVLIAKMPALPKDIDNIKEDSKKIGFDTYPNNTMTTYYRDETGTLTQDIMLEIIGPSAMELKPMDSDKTTTTTTGEQEESLTPFENALIRKFNDNGEKFFRNNLVAFEITANKTIRIYFRKNIPGYPSMKATAQNMASNILLRLTDPAMNVHLEMTEHPVIMRLTERDLANHFAKTPSHVLMTCMIVGIFLPLGLAILAASFVVAPIEEKNCSAKQLQLMTGVSPAIYWTASFLWDWTVMVIVSAVMVIMFLIFEQRDEDGNGAFTIFWGFGVLFLILVIFAYAAVPFAHLFSLFMDSVPCGFATVTVIHFLMSFFAVMSATLMEGSPVTAVQIMATLFRTIGSPFPSFGFTMCIAKYVMIALRKSKCRFLPPNKEALFCAEKLPDWAIPRAGGPTRGEEINVVQCCRKCSKSPDCVGNIAYLTWKTDMLFGENLAGVGQELLYLFLLGTLYFAILILWEVLIGPKLRGRLGKATSHVENVDEDVEEEAQRIMQLVKEKRMTEDALVIHTFSRNFGKFAAVKDVNFGIHHGECFGLLGVNGAGKTTIFRMLTGDESRTSGNAYASGCDLKSSKTRFLGKIGYCPQFDGIVGVLTGLEMVQLFARLRGVKNVTMESKKWMVKVGLTESENVQCRKYSGGMKRRLSAATALIGDPEILLLDEPTTGVDPISRREFWKIIMSTKAEGRAVILTSHSMDEIAACCSRLAIMVNGQLQCLGGVQYLKNRFAQGFSLDLKINSASGSEEELASLDLEIQDKLAPCSLKGSHGTAMQYQIEDPLAPWDVLFSKMEEIKAKYPTLIEDYSISETTLEQVFLAFARMQYPARTAPGRWCSCCCG